MDATFHSVKSLAEERLNSLLDAALSGPSHSP